MLFIHFLHFLCLVKGTDLTGPSGKIESPLYPQYLFLSEQFSWRITVTFGKILSITFTDFYIEAYSEEDCFLNSIEVSL